MVSWTKEQEAAIYTEGRDVLVAAAAGSGKTAVLVERIIQKLLDRDNPVDIDSLLVVTFTNAAAQEMRNRVGAALEKALAENPSSIHLKKQLSLLQRASISTLHAFCLDIVKQYAYLLDIDPSFRIANDMEAEMIKQEVLDDLLEDWYGSDAVNQDMFFQVVDRFSNDRSDTDVETLILQLYDFSVKNPWPTKWLDQLASTYEVPEDVQEEKLTWLTILKREITDQLLAMEQEIMKAMNLTKESDGPYHYAETIEQDFMLVQDAKRCVRDWQQLHELFHSRKFRTLSRKKPEVNEDKKKQVKKIRDSYKKRWTDMKENWFSRNLASHLQDMREMAPVIKHVAYLVKAFKTRFDEEKKRTSFG
jgi:ATP-dependent helicase/nuclease subunit A